MGLYTDLALEMREALNGKDDGVIVDEEQYGNVKVTRMNIIDKRGEDELKRPCGNYITIECGSLCASAYYENEPEEILSKELKKLIGKKAESVLFCGIGNRDMTADALGPLCADKILATKHIAGKTAEEIGLGNVTPVSVISPGVLGQTGLELSEILQGIISVAKPDLLIVADALAAKNSERLGNTIQLSDTGIIPGSGVHNSRNEISLYTMGIPVVSIGVPTVIDSRTLCDNCCNDDKENKHIAYRQMFVTPRETDILVKHSANTVAAGVNLALQPDISKEDMLLLTE